MSKKDAHAKLSLPLKNISIVEENMVIMIVKITLIILLSMSSVTLTHLFLFKLLFENI